MAQGFLILGRILLHNPSVSHHCAPGRALTKHLRCPVVLELRDGRSCPVNSHIFIMQYHDFEIWDLYCVISVFPLCLWGFNMICIRTWWAKTRIKRHSMCQPWNQKYNRGLSHPIPGLASLFQALSPGKSGPWNLCLNRNSEWKFFIRTSYSTLPFVTQFVVHRIWLRRASEFKDNSNIKWT